MKRKLLAVLLAVLMVLSVMPTVVVPKTAVADAQPVDQGIVQGGAILHCFDWSYNEIKAALPDIAAAGYAAVQTSPVQPAKDYNGAWTDTGGNWWKLYQPLDLRVADGSETWLGSKQELIDLCTEAHGYGISVIVDVVANHTANVTSGGYTVNGVYNVSDQVAERLQDPDGNRNLYHTSENGTNDGSRFNMTQYHLSMPDLNTGNSVVQDMVLDFLKECVDCGVDGFRFDAAKHIELPGDAGCGSDFWPYVINGVRNYAEGDLYIYGESLSGSGSDAWVNEFITYIGLTDSQTGNAARDAVVNQNAGALAIGTYTRGDYPQDYVIWAESHDTYEDGGSTGVSSDKILRTWAIVGARANSTALFLARPNETMGLASSDTSWKSPVVAAVNAFKTYYDGTGEYLSYDQDAKITWIERGNANNGAGVVIDKLDGAGWVELNAHLMSDGLYKDEVSGSNFAVTNGKITGNVGPTGVAVVYKTTTGDAPTPPQFSSQMLYLKPSSNWKNDGARFAVYTFGGGEHWYSMSPVEGETDVYGAEITNSYTNVIFCRMNPASTDNNWNNKWNQTGDLTVPSDKNLFIPTEGAWDGMTESWGVYGDVGGVTNPIQVTEDEGYYLVGTMTGWSVLPEYKMERTGAAVEEYTIDVPLLRTSKPFHSQFKIVYSPNGVTDQTWYPEGMKNNYGDYDGEIPLSGVYSVYFRPNYDGENGWHDSCIYAERTKYFVTVNDADKNGTVTVNKSVAAEGETVTVTVTPNEGYELDTLVYMCETGFNTGEFNTTGITGTTFAMPAENASVKATFKETAAGHTVAFVSDPYDWQNGCILVTVEDGALLDKPEDPVQEGYDFGGWYMQDPTKNWEYDEGIYVQDVEDESFWHNLITILYDWDNEGGDNYLIPWDFETDTVTEDVTLYARWTAAVAKPEFKTQSLTLDGSIGVNFYMDLSMLSAEDLADAEKTYMTFDISGKGTVSSDPVPVSTAKKNRTETLYGFTCYVNAIQMADTITATFHYGDGLTVTKDYSIAEYIDSFEEAVDNGVYNEDDDKELIDLVHALADYGHYMQLFLADAKGLQLGAGDDQYMPMDTCYNGNYNFNDVANELAMSGGGFAIDVSNSDTNIKSVTYSVAFESETTIRLIIKPVSGFTGDLEVNAGNGNFTVPLKSKRWTVEIPNIPAHLLGEGHDIMARTDNSGGDNWITHIGIINLSVMTYVQQMLNGNAAAKNAACAVYYYWQAAKEFKEAN